MDALGSLVFVFVAGLITALATGLGAIPFFFVDDVSDRVNVVLWGLASGIMVSASLFGLVLEGLAEADPWGSVLALGLPRSAALATPLVVGLLAGVLLVVVAHDVIEGYEVNPRQYEEADFRKLLLVLGVLTVHSFPEGVAVGVSFAELNLEGGVPILGFAVPLLAVFMTVAISIHNVPEGLAISIPLQSMGVSRAKMVWWAVFSSLPQPIGAVLAFAFVRVAREFLPVGFGFAAGAMVYLVLTEFIPEALDIGAGLPGHGYRELAGGVVAGVVVMVPLVLV
ncbi:ZIP family metal transporter [Salinirubellus salinus]|jgi:ZIP family zinc transporter|uniref:ZIP family metal transporter n=1 Tax=Salinirubellus salinus TaxID=1364945 RepID=A0A9E7QZX7_9EURY|nr:ZIP family metal transporter [Salinirubellus salinus]UWM53111.1 ZIP family metal transporter [Salinirubellus salinus]